ncbi:MAG TPA: AmmeMemoRadiSam system protein A [Firmicutes bacterium]|nr:AmmeMemoRadiSam system protein A [Bacillota bacterium]
MHSLLKIAQGAVETYVRRMEVIGPQNLFPEPGAAFVSLYLHGCLRGCMGTIEPTKPSLEEEVIANAISAATRDPRFPPVQVFELKDLKYSVDVLSPLEEVETIDQLDPAQYGVVVSYGALRGVLLPRLPGVDCPREQVRIAKEKAGIPPGVSYRLARFKVHRYSQ